MHIALITPELTPYSRTGSLADYTRSLAESLGALGQRVSVFTPFHQSARTLCAEAPIVGTGSVKVGGDSIEWQLRSLPSASQSVRLYAIANDSYFDRASLYGDHRGDYHDNCSRFLFFARASLAAAETLGDQVDLYHAHDWQTGLLPAYLRCSLADRPFFQRAACVFTIHQMKYLGQFWHWDWPLLNLPWKHFNWREMEFHGKICYLKAGLVYADLLTTVSPSYAKQIQEAEAGSGLEGLLRERASDLHGIVAGIDTQQWDPGLDDTLPSRFSVADLSGKARCREELFQRCEWSGDEGRPVAALLSPLTEQAGVVLVAQALDELVRSELRLVIVGTGDDRCKTLFQRLRNLHPQRLSVFWTESNQLARLALAGSDLFLRPGLDAPSDVTHFCAQRYGAIPIAQRQGILADTIVDGTPESVADRTATGFLFDGTTAKDLLSAIDRAVDLHRRQPDAWRTIQTAAMQQDWSWARCGRAYLNVFEHARERSAARRT